ncbi:MAG: IgGFc-binding protein [Sandaracinaceae bacterium]|nr:IgGFc-binding protein [Sandaracinaceae bacterium]
MRWAWLVCVLGCGGGGAAPCGSSADCPSGQACIDRTCRPGTDASIDASADAGAAPDAGRRDAGPPIGSGCSADLRDVLGVAGQVLYSCPVDQGCSAGRCIAACDAARATRGTVGCDLFVPTPPSYPPALPPCHAVFVANAWPAAAVLHVLRGGVELDAAAFGRLVDNARPAAEWQPLPATGIPEGEVAVLFLSSDPNAVMPENGVPLTCPVTPAVDSATTIATGVADAFEIHADVPVRAYDILPYGGARSHFPSAQLLLPTNAWGPEHVVIGPPPGTYATPGPLWIQIVAREDATMVRVRPSVDLPESGGLPAIAAGTEQTITLDAGEWAQWETGTRDPSGTLIVSDRPVGVFAGNRFLRLQPTPAPGGESAHQQIFPLDALAHVHVGAPYETRRADLAPEVVPYRLVGAFDGTALAFDPPIAGAPAALDRGEVADFAAAEAFVVRSQDAEHPFAMAQLMPTANVSGGSRPGAIAPGFGPWLGDEEFVLEVPPSQFLSSYVFFTDPAYPTTSLTLVRTRGAAGFAPVSVDCLGEVPGFRAIGSSGEHEMASVDLIRAGVSAAGCANGRHVATSSEPFGLVVWGLDSYSSYAYPAGGNARALAELPPLF